MQNMCDIEQNNLYILTETFHLDFIPQSLKQILETCVRIDGWQRWVC